MSEQELRELNGWLAINVMNYEVANDGREDTFRTPGFTFIFTPTTDPADAMAVLEKCAEKVGFRIAVQAVAGHWEVSRVYWENFTAHVTDIVEAETLPLAICLFALLSEMRQDKLSPAGY